MEHEPLDVSITSHDLVVNENVKKVLQADKGGAAQLLSWKLVDFTKKGDNYATVVTSVEVKYSLENQDLEAVYVVKLNPRRDAGLLTEVFSALCMKEAKFYSDIVPEFNAALQEIGLKPLRVLRYLHSTLEKHKEQVYFEDLRPLDFKMVDRMKGLDVEHTVLVVRELARLHATSVVVQSKSSVALEVKHDFLLRDYLNFTAASKDYTISTRTTNLDNAMKMLEGVKGYERAIPWIDSLKGELEGLHSTKMQSERFGVVCHGDCWNNNLLFRYDSHDKPVEVMLLDFQLCRKASLSADLNYFFFESLETDVRKQNLKYFLSTYFSSFKSVMDAAGLNMFFSEEELLQEYREKNDYGAFFAMQSLIVILMDPSDSINMSKEGSKPEDLHEILRVKARKMMDTNPEFRSRFLGIFDELMDTGMIP